MTTVTECTCWDGCPECTEPDQPDRVTLGPRFKVGDRVYVQLHESSPRLYEDNNRPKLLTVIGIMQTADFKNGWDRPPTSEETLKYVTSYSFERWLTEDLLFTSVEEFEEVRAVEIAALKVKRAAEAHEKRVKQYREAKALVANFEADIFESSLGPLVAW